MLDLHTFCLCPGQRQRRRILESNRGKRFGDGVEVEEQFAEPETSPVMKLLRTSQYTLPLGCLHVRAGLVSLYYLSGAFLVTLGKS